MHVTKRLYATYYIHSILHVDTYSSIQRILYTPDTSGKNVFLALFYIYFLKKFNIFRMNKKNAWMEQNQIDVMSKHWLLSVYSGVCSHPYLTNCFEVWSLGCIWWNWIDTSAKASLLIAQIIANVSRNDLNQETVLNFLKVRRWIFRWKGATFSGSMKNGLTLVFRYFVPNL